MTAKPGVGTSTTKQLRRSRRGVSASAVGHREDRDEIRDRAVADEPLRAVDDVVVAVARGGGPDRGDIRAGLGLGQGEGDELLPGRQLRDEACLLLVGAGDEERQRGQLLDREDQAGRRAGATELLDGQADAQEVATETAVFLRERQRQDVLGGEQLAEVLRELTGPVDLGGPWRDAFVGKDADSVAEERLLLGQPIRGRRRVGHRRHASGFGVADRAPFRLVRRGTSWCAGAPSAVGLG